MPASIYQVVRLRPGEHLGRRNPNSLDSGCSVRAGPGDMFTERTRRNDPLEGGMSIQRAATLDGRIRAKPAGPLTSAAHAPCGGELGSQSTGPGGVTEWDFQTM